jgi:hypothetical protein
MLWLEAAQTMRASAKAAESNSGQSVPGRNNAALDAGNEPMFIGNLLQP